MDVAKDVSTPLSTYVSLKLLDGASTMDQTKYKKIIGALQYLLLTRSNTNFEVNKLSQLMHQPITTYWVAIKCLLRYLKNTIFHGLMFHKDAAPTLLTYFDTNWVRNFDDRSSISAYLIFLG